MKHKDLHLWLWEYENEQGKRVVSRWRMSEENAKHYRNAVKVEGSLEIRKPLGSTSAWQPSPPKR